MRVNTDIPGANYSNSVVLYWWAPCPHCTKLMPEWRRALEALPESTSVYEIEVDENRERLHEMGVDLGNGVPRIEVYNHEGDMMVYEGGRDAVSMIQSIIPHLLTIRPGHVNKNLPALVLYFRHNCGFCVKFLPEFIRFSAATDTSVFMVDTSKYPDALQTLTTPASGVPHVVYHDSRGTDHEFKGPRTAEALHDFVDHHHATHHPSRAHGVSFKGGSLKPASGSAETRLTEALDTLQDKAKRVLGRTHGRAFEPDNASVHYVGFKSSDLPGGDRIYILLCPNKTPRGKPSVMAAVYGPRGGNLFSKIYVGKQINTLLQGKKSSGFSPVMETNPFVQYLQAFGYDVGFS